MVKLPLVPLKSQVDRIQSAYAGAAKRIVDILSALDPATFTSADHGATLRKVQEVIVILNDQVRSWAPEAIRAAYKESAGVAQTRLELIGAKKLPVNRYNPARHDRKIDALTRFVLRDFYKANLTMEKTAKKYLAVMLQAATNIKKVGQIQEFSEEEVLGYIKRIVSGSLRARTKYNAGEAHLTVQDIAAKIRTKLTDVMKGGDFITINGRNYNIRSYAELVARTRMREAQTEATKELCKQFDNDLVVFSAHDSPCDECSRREGQVYSLSGDNPRYPTLAAEDEPPIHPNCEHTLNPTSATAIAYRGR